MIQFRLNSGYVSDFHRFLMERKKKLPAEEIPHERAAEKPLSLLAPEDIAFRLEKRKPE